MVGEMLSELETLSINIEQKKRIVGNIIFTSFKLNDLPDKKCYLLAPIGADAVFVLGYPKYYGIRGFYPTYVTRPYQTEIKRIDAWKMMEKYGMSAGKI